MSEAARSWLKNRATNLTHSARFSTPAGQGQMWGQQKKSMSSHQQPHRVDPLGAVQRAWGGCRVQDEEEEGLVAAGPKQPGFCSIRTRVLGGRHGKALDIVGVGGGGHEAVGDGAQSLLQVRGVAAERWNGHKAMHHQC